MAGFIGRCSSGQQSEPTIFGTLGGELAWIYSKGHNPFVRKIEQSKEEQKLEISALEEVDKLLADLENGNV